MQVKHTDFEISKDNPFANCKLDREEDARALNDLIESIEGGGTIAINGAWGFGKTTFLRMWKQDLEQRGYRVILFNAWETDFSTEPLVSILGELGSLINDPSDTQLEKITQGLAKFTKRVFPLALSMFLKQHIGIDYAEIVKELGEHAMSSFEEEVRSYKERKDELGKIKKRLEKLVEAQSPGKPVIFIVDELDRCRPDYAVEVLEKIKHLFSVNNLIFVLAVDKEQLCHAIKGYYGSSELNASEYLRRFIDIEYDLRGFNYENIVRYFFGYFALVIHNLRQDSNPGYEIVRLIATISQDQSLSIRQVEKWIVKLCPINAVVELHKNHQPSVIVLLTFFRLFYPMIYQGIKDYTFSLPRFIQETKKLFVNRLTEELRANTNTNSFLSYNLGILFLAYLQTLVQKRHTLSLNLNGATLSQEEVLDTFFENTPPDTANSIKAEILKRFCNAPIATGHLTSILID